MKKDEFIIDCGGIQPDPLERPMEEIIVDPTFQVNEKIKEAIHQYHQEQTNERYDLGCFAVRDRMLCGGQLIFPAEITENEDGATKFLFKTMGFDGMNFLVAFTDREEYKKRPAPGAVSMFIDVMLENIMQQEDIAGVIINPWGEPFVLCKADIVTVLGLDEK